MGKKVLHWSKVRGSTPGQGLHVRVGKAGHLQIFLCLQDVCKGSHKTHRRPSLKQHNATNHAEFWVESPVREELHSHFLNLIQKDKCWLYKLHRLKHTANFLIYSLSSPIWAPFLQYFSRPRLHQPGLSKAEQMLQFRAWAGAW